MDFRIKEVFNGIASNDSIAGVIMSLNIDEFERCFRCFLKI
jgi:hypothetical protein